MFGVFFLSIDPFRVDAAIDSTPPLHRFYKAVLFLLTLTFENHHHSDDLTETGHIFLPLSVVRVRLK